eukprot:TRINITY_DN52271_c0_g1_i1.p1 TRINITY_DN52271_c0_g1~~TRINITY_DN52271_c0_g1_i1.p1  ORF type:complete len:230 (-),score=34.24 TRINITY_DN52271_c0_g1_i1:132-821(-)
MRARAATCGSPSADGNAADSGDDEKNELEFGHASSWPKAFQDPPRYSPPQAPKRKPSDACLQVPSYSLPGRPAKKPCGSSGSSTLAPESQEDSEGDLEFTLDGYGDEGKQYGDAPPWCSSDRYFLPSAAVGGSYCDENSPRGGGGYGTGTDAANTTAAASDCAAKAGRSRMDDFRVRFSPGTQSPASNKPLTGRPRSQTDVHMCASPVLRFALASMAEEVRGRNRLETM